MFIFRSQKCKKKSLAQRVFDDKALHIDPDVLVICSESGENPRNSTEHHPQLMVLVHQDIKIIRTLLATR